MIMLKSTHESVLALKETELRRELAKIKRLQNQIYRYIEEIKHLKNKVDKLEKILECKSKCWEDDYKTFKNISEENKKYKLQIDTIEALKEQFRKEIDISFKLSETLTEKDIKTVATNSPKKLLKLYQLLGLM